MVNESSNKKQLNAVFCFDGPFNLKKRFHNRRENV